MRKFGEEERDRVGWGGWSSAKSCGPNKSALNNFEHFWTMSVTHKI